MKLCHINLDGGSIFNVQEDIEVMFYLCKCSNASCTTNCLAPFAKILDEEFGKQKINTVQIYVVLNVRLFISSETDSLPSQIRGKAVYAPPSQISLVGLHCVCCLTIFIHFVGIVKGTMTTTHSYTGDQVIMIYDTTGEFVKTCTLQ